MNEEKDFNTTQQSPPKQLGKGYSYLFAFLLTGFLSIQSINIKASSEHWEVSLQPVPASILLPGMALIASILGLDTDKLAEKLGAFLSKGDRE